MSRRTAVLQEMGLGPVWSRRQAAPSSALEIVEPPTPAPSAAAQAEAPPVTRTTPETLPVLSGSLAEDVFTDDIPPQFFDDIPWEEGASIPPGLAASTDSPEPPKPDVSGMNWEQLEATILQCTACGLCQGRTQAVPGVGDRRAAWLFVGEGPGFVEDQQGEPFVGPSGKLLDNMLLAMGLKRGENAYIANIVKCRPTDANGKDRPPTHEEAAACRPFLERQITLLQPEIIVTLGKTAAMMLLGSDPQTSLAAMRGKTHVYTTPQGRGIPLVATYHPAYLLRQLPDKKKAWADLCLALRTADASGENA